VAGRRGATPTHRRHHHGGGGDRRRPGMRVAEPATRVATIWLSRLLAGYMQRSGVRPSVRLSVPSVDRCSSVRRVCCWAPRGNPVHIVEADATQTRQFCRGKSGPALGGTEFSGRWHFWVTVLCAVLWVRPQHNSSILLCCLKTHNTTT